MENSRCHRLFWVCGESGQRYPAGVAFYNEPQGDYRLKVDMFAEDKVYYLKPVGTAEGLIQFRVEAALRKNGVVYHRTEVGIGHASAEAGFPVYMDVGPFSRALVMEAASV